MLRFPIQFSILLSIGRTFRRGFVSSQVSQDGPLNGNVAIVTASTDGIGLAIARRLLKDGAKVVISSRREANLEKALAGLYEEGISKDRILGTVCHVGVAKERTELIHKTVQEFGGVDLLVSNAAVNPVLGLRALDVRCPESAWDKIFDVNLKAPFLLCKELLPHLLGSKSASIVFISSFAAYHPFQEMGIYSVSKTALLGLSKVLAQQLGENNIRVNCVSPGVIRTRFSQAVDFDPEYVIITEYIDKALEQIPLGRIGEPHEIAGLVAFLCSQDASYITGEHFVIAGGHPTRL